MNTTFNHETGEWESYDPDYPQVELGHGDTQHAAEIAAGNAVVEYLQHLRHGNAVAELTRLWEDAWKLMDRRTNANGTIDDNDGAVNRAMKAAEHLESLIFPDL